MFINGKLHAVKDVRKKTAIKFIFVAIG